MDEFIENAGLTEQQKKKIYNMTYYKKNRLVVLEKLKAKQQCELCGKLVSSSNMHRHKNSGACIHNGFEKVSKKDQMIEMKNKINELETKINEINNKGT